MYFIVFITDLTPAVSVSVIPPTSTEPDVSAASTVNKDTQVGEQHVPKNSGVLQKGKQTHTSPQQAEKIKDGKVKKCKQKGTLSIYKCC